MTPEEFAFVKHICITRSKHSGGVFLGMAGIVAYLMVRGHLYEDISIVTLIAVNVIFSAMCGIGVFLMSAAAYFRDMLSKEVAVTTFYIIDKCAFPDVNRFYIKLDDVLEPFYEVYAGEFQMLEIGQTYKIRATKYARYRFNNMGKYQLI
ncbi:hypothetical protein D3C71_74180 [compost metagenome]